MKDHLGREIDYLRISVTDRCNLRCIYCMPAEGVAWKSHKEMLRIEEIARVARIAAEEGIRKVRLTGGEPLVKKGLVSLITDIKAAGIQDVSLTTNGILLPRMAQELKDAGLDRVNISLDTLDAQKYREITRLGNIEDVFAAIDAALDPAQTDYYYYALGKDGRHHFSSTLAEHNNFLNSSNYVGN